MDRTLPIGDIVVRPGHPVRATPDEVTALSRALGKGYEPLLITKQHVLLDGRTRLEALKLQHATQVRVEVVDVADTTVAAHLASDETFSRPKSRLNRLWRLLLVAKEYVALHPEAVPVTVKGGPGRGGKKSVADSAAVSFADHAAKALGTPARTIRSHLQLARALHPDVFEVLEPTSDKNRLSHLAQLSKLPPERQIVVAKKVASRRTDLRQAIAHELARQQGRTLPRLRLEGCFCALPGDYIEVAKKLPDEVVDLVLTDVPWQGPMKKRFGEMSSLFHAKLRPGGIALVMVGQRWVPEMLDALRRAKLEYLWLSHYEHTAPQGPPHEAVAISWGYPILVMAKPGAPRTFIDPTDYFRETQGVHLDLPDHPHRKSIEAFERMILAYSNPEDLVYDPFVGSGTTALAAWRTRRRFFGSDINPDNISALNGVMASPSAGDWGADLTGEDTLVFDRVEEAIKPEDWSHIIATW